MFCINTSIISQDDEFYCAFPNVDRSLIDVHELNELLDFVIRKDLEEIEKLKVKINHFAKHFIKLFYFYFKNNAFLKVDIAICQYKIREVEKLSKEINNIFEILSVKDVIKNKIIRNLVNHFSEIFKINEEIFVNRYGEKYLEIEELEEINWKLKNLVKKFYKLLLLDPFDYESLPGFTVVSHVCKTSHSASLAVKLWDVVNNNSSSPSDLVEDSLLDAVNRTGALDVAKHNVLGYGLEISSNELGVACLKCEQRSCVCKAP